MTRSLIRVQSVVKAFQKSIERRFKNSASFYLDHVGAPEKRSLKFEHKEVI